MGAQVETQKAIPHASKNCSKMTRAILGIMACNTGYADLLINGKEVVEMKKWSDYGRADGPKDAEHYSGFGFAVGPTIADLGTFGLTPDPWGEGEILIFSFSAGVDGGVFGVSFATYYEGTDFWTLVESGELERQMDATWGDEPLPDFMTAGDAVGMTIREIQPVLDFGWTPLDVLTWLSPIGPMVPVG